MVDLMYKKPLRLAIFAVVGFTTGVALSYLVGIGWAVVMGIVAYIFVSTLKLYQG